MRDSTALIGMLACLFIFGGLISLGGCGNWRAKNLGGTTTVQLEEGKQVVNATWKDSDLWILVKDRPKEEKPQTYTLKEFSNIGVMQGTVVIKEK